MSILVCDIGGTFIKYAVMNPDLSILRRGKIATPTTGREDFLAALSGLYEENKEDVDGIAISLPGIIDAGNGYIAMGGALTFNNDFYLRHDLYERCPVPIVMENDAKCAAYAEATVGSLQDVANGFVLIFGTMIGGAFIHNHELYRGRHFSAGEVSYITTRGSGLPEDHSIFGIRCSVPKLCRDYAQRAKLDPEKVDGELFFAAVNRGEETAIDCLNEFAHKVAVQIFNLQTVLDPERIAIGGGISAQPAFVEAIRRQLKKLYSVCSFDLPRAEVVTCKFRNDANLVGALQSYLHRYPTARTEQEAS